MPYRDSKLTRILQPSLSGNAKIAVICTISPAANNFEESNNTLKFAARTKKVVTRAQVNELMDDKALLQVYRSEISELKNRMFSMNEQLQKYKTEDRDDFERERARYEDELQEQQLVRTALKERIDHLTKLILTSSSMSSQAVLSDWAPHTQVRFFFFML